MRRPSVLAAPLCAPFPFGLSKPERGEGQTALKYGTVSLTRHARPLPRPGIAWSAHSTRSRSRFAATSTFRTDRQTPQGSRASRSASRAESSSRWQSCRRCGCFAPFPSPHLLLTRLCTLLQLHGQHPDGERTAGRRTIIARSASGGRAQSLRVRRLRPARALLPLRHSLRTGPRMGADHRTAVVSRKAGALGVHPRPVTSLQSVGFARVGRCRQNLPVGGAFANVCVMLCVCVLCVV